LKAIQINLILEYPDYQKSHKIQEVYMKILVCVDGSEYSQKALGKASIIAKGCHADEVAIIHVYEIFVPLISFSTEQMESIRRLTKEHQEERKKMLSEALKFFRPEGYSFLSVH